MDEMQEEGGVSHGLLLGCPIGLALMLVGLVLVVTLGAVMLGFVTF